MPGTLFVVGTPIGNLEDLSFRALRILKEVDAIAAEDTRRTAKLLSHYQIRKPLVSVREHNEARETPRLVRRLERGESLALVTDAGTPGIADPGSRVVRAVRQAGIPVVPIPGPSAVTAALSVSGFTADEFVFLGYPPRSENARAEWISHVAGETRVCVFFESPHRIDRTLDELVNMVTRPIIVSREISKIYESTIEYQNDIGIQARGEFTIVVGSQNVVKKTIPDEMEIVNVFGRLTDIAGFGREVAAQLVSHLFGVSQRTALKIIKKHQFLVNSRSITAP